MAIFRTYSKELLTLATNQMRDELKGFDPDFWAKNEENIALCNIKGDVGLFEFIFTGVVNGHYFFQSRGKEAIKVATEMIDYLFDNFEITVIRGLTPRNKRGALWMNRRLGFTYYGDVDTEVGACAIVILTKDEWNQRK